MGRHKKPTEVDLSEDEMKLPVKGNIIKMAGRYIAGFSGDSYEHSLKLAWEWVNDYNLNHDDKRVLRDQFQQIHSHKSILVSYDVLKEKEETVSILVD